MLFFSQFLQVYLHYCQELWFTLAIGFFLSGIFYKFIPTKIVESHLGEHGVKSILISSFVGVILPVCCVGALPIALTLRRKGASLGAVFAFLVATPATSISALIVCWKLLGAVFTISIFFAAIIISLVMGVIFNLVPIQMKEIEEGSGGAQPGSCCHKNSQEMDHKLSFLQKIKEALQYAFVVLPKEIGVEVLIGIAIASFIVVFEPIQHWITAYLTGVMGYFFILIIGLVTYVCSTASVPMADALLQSGISQGQALCYLLVGPITSYGTILVIKKDFGGRALVLYLSVICVISLLFGGIFDVFFNSNGQLPF